MSDRGAPKIAGLLALGAVVWVIAFWVWPNGDAAEPPTSLTQAGPGTEPVGVPHESPGEHDPVDPVPVVSIDPGIDDQPGNEGDDSSNGVEPPIYRIHVVEPGGQTLQEISKQYYGTFNYWRAIARMNGHSVDPNRLLPGTEVKVPRDPENVQGLSSDDEGDPDLPAPEPETQYTEYIVSRNDSLWTIAKALYGSGVKWTVIRDANRELVGNEGQKLRPGMILRIPPPPGN